MYKTVIFLLAAMMLVFLPGCASSPQPIDTAAPTSGAVTISFDFQKQSGHASNQFAVWIEDADGGFIKTLYATRFTAKGGYKNRPDSIPLWVERSGLASLASVDAISGATPSAGLLAYTWDLTDADGALMPAGTYKFFVEGSLRWKNRVLYSGEIEIGSGETSAAAEAEFIYEAADNQPALTDDATEHGMIGPVTAIYLPTQP